MKTKSLIIALLLSMGVFTSCTDKKKTKTETSTEVIKEKTKVEDTTSEDEKRRLDSIQQVKEHGHAH